MHLCSYFSPGSSPKKFPSRVSVLSMELPVQVAAARGERGCVQGRGGGPWGRVVWRGLRRAGGIECFEFMSLSFHAFLSIWF